MEKKKEKERPNIDIGGIVPGGFSADIMDDFNIILDDPNDKYLLDQVQDGYLSWISLTSAIKLAFKNRRILKILGISANLNDILDKLDTILDDPYDRYLS